MISQYLQHIQFDRPWVLLLLAAVPLLWWYMVRHADSRVAALRFPDVQHLRSFGSRRMRWRHFPHALRALAIACCLVALAKPARYQNITLTEGNGIDIVLCLDISGSMLARDFQPDRLQASIAVARSFVDQRPGDRIGLVAFSGQSLSLCPLTTDHDALRYQLSQLEYGQLADGTSIGTGLASAVDRLKKSPSPSRIIILLTDGEDTGGFLDPVTATNLATGFGIKVYTIGVGTMGYAPMPYKTATGTELRQEKVSIDEKLLSSIALQTGGQYYRATNRQALDSVYQTIDRLERSDVRTSTFVKRTDAYLPWALAACLLIALELLLQSTVLRKLP